MKQDPLTIFTRENTFLNKYVERKRQIKLVTKE